MDMKEYLLMILLLLSGVASGQQKSITVSGVVMDADTLNTIAYVNIRLKDTYFGTVSDNTGHFNFTASEGDTLRFSSVGYFDAFFIMPDKLAGDSYSLIQLMRKETIMLDEVVIFPWPEYMQLKEAFMSATPERTMDDVANEAQRKVKRISDEEYERNKHYYNMYYNNQLYDMTGIVPANNFLNPFNWSNLIRDVKHKKQKKQKK
jgi:hypothetical protein